MLNEAQRRQGRAARYLLDELRVSATHAEAQLIYARGLQRRWARSIARGRSAEGIRYEAFLAQQRGRFEADVRSLRYQMSGLALRIRELEAT